MISKTCLHDKNSQNYYRQKYSFRSSHSLNCNRKRSSADHDRHRKHWLFDKNGTQSFLVTRAPQLSAWSVLVRGWQVVVVAISLRRLFILFHFFFSQQNKLNRFHVSDTVPTLFVFHLSCCYSMTVVQYRLWLCEKLVYCFSRRWLRNPLLTAKQAKYDRVRRNNKTVTITTTMAIAEVMVTTTTAGYRRGTRPQQHY